MRNSAVQVNVDYSAVSLEDIIIDALPLQDGKMIGMPVFLVARCSASILLYFPWSSLTPESMVS